MNGNTLRIEPPHEVRPAEIDTYDDHRMAMSLRRGRHALRRASPSAAPSA